METGLIKGTGTSATLPARRSIEYVAWLVIRLGELAAYLGKSDALDKEGYRASEMAQDLADTDPAIMEAALRELRRETQFFPTTKEILDAYTTARRAKYRQDDAEVQRQAQAEEDALRRMARERPQDVVNVKELITEALKKRGEKSRDE